MEFECVILDEAHRARRRNLGPGKEYDAPEPNNLLTFLYEVSPRTRSLLLATATPDAQERKQFLSQGWLGDKRRKPS